MLIQKKSFKRHLQIIMNKDISKIVQLPLEGGDSLTGKTSLGETPILKLRLFFKDDEVSDVIVKCKSSKVILNGIKLLNYEKAGSYIVLWQDIIEYLVLMTVILYDWELSAYWNPEYDVQISYRLHTKA